MKKLIAFLLSLILPLIACAPPVMAEAGGTMDRNLFVRVDEYADVPHIISAVAVGDALYMLSEQDLYRYLPGEAEPTLWTENANRYVERDEKAQIIGGYELSHLFAMDGCLYGVGFAALRSARVLKLADQSGAPVQETLCELDMTGVFGEYIDNITLVVERVFVLDGLLYLVAKNNAAWKFPLFSFELANGAQAVSKRASGMMGFSPYKNGRLLAVKYPETYVEGEPYAYLVSYDPSTEEDEIFYPLEGEVYDAGVAWDEQRDIVYHILDSELYCGAGPGQAAQVCGHLPSLMDNPVISFLQSGLVAIPGFGGVYLREPNVERAAEGTLVVAGDYGSEQHRSIVAAHPEMSIATNNAFMLGVEQLSNAMVSGAGSMDVLRLSAEVQPLQELIRKGYALELNGFPAIMEIAAEMDERFLAPFQRDGKLYAIPVFMNGAMLTVNRELWTERLGLSLDELPTTFAELLDFVANYPYDYGDDHEDIRLIEAMGLKYNLVRYALDAEVAYQAREGARLSFNTERFRRLMKMIDQIDFSEFVTTQGMSEQEQLEYDAKPALLETLFGIRSPASMGDDSRTIPVPLALEEGLEPAIPASIEVLLINPRTALPEAAAAYIAAYAGCLDSTAEAITLFPNRNEAVTDADFERKLAEKKKALDRLEASLAAAAPENRAAIRYEILWTTSEYEDYEKTGGILVSTEQIAQYRERISPYLQPVMQTPLTDFDGAGGQAILSLMQQFAGGAINVDSFASELDKRVRLMLLEGE